MHWLFGLESSGHKTDNCGEPRVPRAGQTCRTHRQTGPLTWCGTGSRKRQRCGQQTRINSQSIYAECSRFSSRTLGRLRELRYAQGPCMSSAFKRLPATEPTNSDAPYIPPATRRLVAPGLRLLLFSMRLRSLRQALGLYPREFSWRTPCATYPRPCAEGSRGKSSPQCRCVPV